MQKVSKLEKLKHIPSDLSYLSFQYELDAKITIDDRINHQLLSIHFCLKLTQSINYTDSGNIEALLPP